MKLKLKQLLACVIAITMLTGLFAVSVTANTADDIRVFLDGEELEFDVAPQIVDERTMVPMRAIFEALGATIEWDDETQTVTAVRDETTVVMQVGNYLMFVNDNEITLDVAPLIEGDRTLVQVRAVAEGLDADVQWDGVARVVTITSMIVDDAGDGDEERSYIPIAVRQFRHSFEQIGLPRLVFGHDFFELLLSYFYEHFEAYELAGLAEHVILYEWFVTSGNPIAGFLVDSDIGYSADDMDTLTESILAMQEVMSLGPEHIVSVVFESINDSTNAIIIEMLNINEHLISTFIAIAYNEHVGLRYFTLEQPLNMFGDSDPLFVFSYVEVGERGSLAAIENSREAFIEAVRYEMTVD